MSQGGVISCLLADHWWVFGCPATSSPLKWRCVRDSGLGPRGGPEHTVTYIRQWGGLAGAVRHGVSMGTTTRGPNLVQVARPLIHTLGQKSSNTLTTEQPLSSDRAWPANANRANLPLLGEEVGVCPRKTKERTQSLCIDEFRARNNRRLNVLRHVVLH